jgi:hypothetical protein
MDGGTWNELGVYDFYESGTVTIISQGDGCSTSADAVKFQAAVKDSSVKAISLPKPLVPQPAGPSEVIIIDNGDPSSRSVGSWSSSTGLNSYGSRSVFAKVAGSKYIFETMLTGSSAVSLWWTVTSSRCANVPVEIYDGGTLLDRVYVDQNMDGGTWNELGVYDFYESGTVKIISQSDGCSTNADAVRFQQ